VLARRVTAIVGPTNERDDDGTERLEALRRLARRLLRPRPLSPAQNRKLRAMALTKPVAPSVIVRTLTAWRFGVGERDVRRMQQSLHEPQVGTGKPRPRVKLIYA
jgi:hypothetical protein